MTARIAIITGCSAGIGKATATRFVAEGWTVHNLSRRPSGVDQVIDHAADLTDLPALEATAKALRDAIPAGATVCLVHNSAVMEQAGIADLEAAQFERVMRLNVSAPALLTTWLLPALGPGSSVLFIGSTLSEQGVAGRVSYVTSKHAVIGLMRSVCQDLFGQPIHTVAICPGLVDTEMVRPAYDASPEFRQFIQDKVAAGRLIDSAEMAEVIYRAALMPVFNGAVLHANLGQRST